MNQYIKWLALVLVLTLSQGCAISANKSSPKSSSSAINTEHQEEIVVIIPRVTPAERVAILKKYRESSQDNSDKK
jgi:hypothetical protein